jgi:3'-5' exoribonuclease
MKPAFISDLKPDQTINTVFLVQNKDVRQKKSGEPYLSLMLSDRTGEIDAKMWDNVAEIMDTFDRDDFLNVKGQTLVHHNRLQIMVHKLRRLSNAEVDLADFVPSSSRDAGEMWAELRGIVREVANPHLNALLAKVLDDEQIAGRYRAAPAAKQIHHAYLGGLLEHVLSLCHLARFASAHYKVDRDLLVAGAVLHDLGKIYELSYDRTFGYSTEGQLLGHMAIALRIVGEKLCELPEFPPKLRAVVEHMIISHHGQVEFGSARLPQFPEALLLHHLDAMDAKMESMRAALAHDRNVEGCHTGYHAVLDRAILKMDRYLDGEPKRAEAIPAVAGAPAGAPPPPKEGSVFGDKLLQALGGKESERA